MRIGITNVLFSHNRPEENICAKRLGNNFKEVIISPFLTPLSKTKPL